MKGFEGWRKMQWKDDGCKTDILKGCERNVIVVEHTIFVIVSIGSVFGLITCYFVRICVYLTLSEVRVRVIG